MRSLAGFLLAVLAVPVAVLQGWLVYWYLAPGGPFLGSAGAQCTVLPLLVELVLGIVTIKNLDQLHASAVANPHSLLGDALRRDQLRPEPAKPYGDERVSEPQKAAADLRRRPFE